MSEIEQARQKAFNLALNNDYHGAYTVMLEIDSALSGELEKLKGTLHAALQRTESQAVEISRLRAGVS